MVRITRVKTATVNPTETSTKKRFINLIIYTKLLTHWLKYRFIELMPFKCYIILEIHETHKNELSNQER